MTIGQPSPGLPAGLLVNSAVFVLGINVLLKGNPPLIDILIVLHDHCDLSHEVKLHTLKVHDCPYKQVDVGRAGLTGAGVLHSWALGTAIYSAFGAGGYVLVCLYFILGSAVCTHEAGYIDRA